MDEVREFVALTDENLLIPPNHLCCLSLSEEITDEGLRIMITDVEAKKYAAVTLRPDQVARMIRALSERLAAWIAAHG